MKNKPFPGIPWSKEAMIRIARIFAEGATEQFDRYESHLPLCFVFPKGRDSTMVELEIFEGQREKMAYYRKLSMDIREFLGGKPAGMVTVVEVGHEDHPEGEEYRSTLDILVEHDGCQPVLVTYPIQTLLDQEGEMKRRVNRDGVLLGCGRTDHRSMLGHFLLGPGKVHSDLGPRSMPICDFKIGPNWKWISDPVKKIEGPEKGDNSETPTLSNSQSAKS